MNPGPVCILNKVFKGLIECLEGNSERSMRRSNPNQGSNGEEGRDSKCRWKPNIQATKRDDQRVTKDKINGVLSPQLRDNQSCIILLERAGFLSLKDEILFLIVELIEDRIEGDCLKILWWSLLFLSLQSSYIDACQTRIMRERRSVPPGWLHNARRESIQELEDRGRFSLLARAPYIENE